MTSLSDKLKSMGVQLGMKSPKPKVENAQIPIDKVVNGRYEATEFGDLFVHDNLLPFEHFHGNLDFSTDFNPARIFEWARINRDTHSPIDEIFLDTETTGLAGGTGTFAFMVGVGRFTENGFLTTQLFMRDPGDEKAMLAYLEMLLAKHPLLISFNGKSFDVPILKTRFELNLFPSPFGTQLHVDVLHLARRIWKLRLENRSLKDLENKILEFNRAEEEIPGWLVPQMYVDYLRSGDATPLKGVFYHNEMDIVSLAALYKHLSQFMIDPLSLQKTEGLDIVSLAKVFEDLNHFEEALELYRSGIDAGLPEQFYASTFSRYGHIFRQHQNWLKAVEAWGQAAAHGHIESAIDMAKTFEHRIKDLQSAKDWSLKAMAMVDASDLHRYQKKDFMKELEKRLKRLEGKIASTSVSVE